MLSVSLTSICWDDKCLSQIVENHEKVIDSPGRQVVLPLCIPKVTGITDPNSKLHIAKKSDRDRYLKLQYVTSERARREEVEVADDGLRYDSSGARGMKNVNLVPWMYRSKSPLSAFSSYPYQAKIGRAHV